MVSTLSLDYRGDVTGVVIEANGVRLWMYPEGPSNGGGDEVSFSNLVAVSGGETTFEFDPTDAVEQAAHIAARLGQHVTVSIQEEENRDVVVTFGDGYRWVCGPDDRFEAWEVNAGGSKWISTPGGELDFFGPPARS